jgi:hypothetical protein
VNRVVLVVDVDELVARPELRSLEPLPGDEELLEQALGQLAPGQKCLLCGRGPGSRPTKCSPDDPARVLCASAPCGRPAALCAEHAREVAGAVHEELGRRCRSLAENSFPDDDLDPWIEAAILALTEAGALLCGQPAGEATPQ